MKLAKDDIVDALRLRYDHYSATSIFDAALARADLVDQAEYTPSEVAAFRAVLVCGGFADLGDWDPEHARAMRRDGDLWLTTVRLPANADVSFKFLRRTSDGTVIWEDGDNRSLTGGKSRVDATWR